MAVLVEQAEPVEQAVPAEQAEPAEVPVEQVREIVHRVMLLQKLELLASEVLRQERTR